MTWKEKIPGCFGSADRIFAGSEYEKEKARDMAKEAAAAGATITEVEAEAENWLISQNVQYDHADEQLSRVRDPLSYF